MATINFLGFKQATATYYRGLSDAEKKHYLWLIRDVREVSGNTSTHSEIYFGTRKYAEVNEDAANEYTVNNIIEAIGLLDADGAYAGFMADDTDIMADATTIKEALIALETALKEKADTSYVNDQISGVTTEMTELINGVSDDIDAEAERASRVEEDLQSQIDAITSGSVVDVKFENSTIFLVNGEGEQVGEGFDASDFVKDGILDSVVLSGETLVFSFNTDSEKTDIEVPLDYFISPSELNTIIQAEETRATEAEEALGADIVALSGDVQTVIEQITTETIEREEAVSDLSDALRDLADIVSGLTQDNTHIITGDDIEE